MVEFMDKNGQFMLKNADHSGLPATLMQPQIISPAHWDAMGSCRLRWLKRNEEWSIVTWFITIING